MLFQNDFFPEIIEYIAADFDIQYMKEWQWGTLFCTSSQPTMDVLGSTHREIICLINN
jgi:hypothetical protein